MRNFQSQFHHTAVDEDEKETGGGKEGRYANSFKLSSCDFFADIGDNRCLILNIFLQIFVPHNFKGQRSEKCQGTKT